MKLGENVTRLPKNKCLNCKKALDSATGIGNENSPSPGDITVCLRCGHIMAFNKQLRFRKLTDEEIIAIAGDPRIIEFQRARGKVFPETMKSGKIGSRPLTRGKKRPPFPVKKERKAEN
jgi:hypothetical protein